MKVQLSFWWSIYLFRPISRRVRINSMPIVCEQEDARVTYIMAADIDRDLRQVKIKMSSTEYP